MNNLVKDVLLELRDLDLEYEVEEDDDTVFVTCDDFLTNRDYFEAVLGEAVENINLDREDEGELEMGFEGNCLVLIFHEAY